MARGSRKVSVAVRTGQGEHVEHLTDRPVRRMPDGVSGVVYGGRVYPVNEGMFICLDDPSVPKTDCDDFVGPSEDLVVLVEPSASSSLTVSRWAIESTRFGHYVVLDAIEADADELVRRLETSGITVKRWAQSWRPASDGHHYDWFIRLGGDMTPDQCVTAVTDALGNSSGTPPASPVENNAALARAHDALLRVELIVAQSQLQTARREVDALTADLDGARDDRDDLKKQLKAAKSARTKAEKQLAALQINPPAAEEKTDGDLLAAESLLEEAHTRAEVQDLEIVRLQQQLDHAQRTATGERDLREQLTAATVAAPPRSSPAKGVEGVLDRMFSRLDLHETTLDAFTDLKQFRALSHLLRVLVDLDTKKLNGEKCEGYADVHEVRGIHTGLKGSERMGRLYYRPDLEADRLLVFVHRKKDDKDQREFLEKISKGAVVLGR